MGNPWTDLFDYKVRPADWASAAVKAARSVGVNMTNGHISVKVSQVERAAFALTFERDGVGVEDVLSQDGKVAIAEAAALGGVVATFHGAGSDEVLELS